MAANAWGVPAAGAWADDEPEEAPAPTQYVNPAARAAAAHTDFPSLGEAVKVPAKAKKSKGTKLQLGDFLGSGPAKAVFQRRNDDRDILAQLPTAPLGADRPESDMEGLLGGGFKDYGGNRGGFGGGGGGFGDRGDRDGPRGRREDDFGASSRADDTDDWGTTKKFEPTGVRGGMGGPGGESRRPGGFSDRPVGQSDAVDDWGSNKAFTPSEPRPGGFRDGPRGGDRSSFAPSKADEEDEWGKGRQFQPSDPQGGRGGGGGGGRPGFGFSDRPGADEGPWQRKGPMPEADRPAHGGSAAERPRLNLAPRTKPVEAAAAPAGAATDGTASGDQSKPKSNPFGAARPREEVLKEKGIDPAKDDVPLSAVKRDEAPEEALMKAEVEALRKQLEVIKASGPDPESIADEVASAEEDVAAKLAELAKLSADLDAKARIAAAEAAAVADTEKNASAAPPDDGTWDRAGPARGGDGGRGPAGRGSGGGGAGGRGATADRPERGGLRGPPADRPERAPFAGAPGKDRW